MKDGKLDKRLPPTLKPLHYLVKLQPFINANFSFLGYVEVEMEVLEPTSSITLHMADTITKNDTVKLSRFVKIVRSPTQRISSFHRRAYTYISVHIILDTHIYLVTPKWWDDTWLSEGFATYMTVLGVAAAQPEAPWEGVRILQQVLRQDSLQSSHNISIQCLSGILMAVFSFLRDQGASVIRMMSRFLAQATFRKGLNNYLNSFKYSNADQDDLWEYLTDAAHQDGVIFDFDTVKLFMDPWTLQEGYLVVRFARSADGTSGSIAQEHFLSGNRNLSGTHDYRRWIPLSVTIRSEADFSRTKMLTWLRDYSDYFNVSHFSAEDEWVIFNLQQTGYYRVNYDDRNWGLLIQQLKDDHKVIHVINRAQIIDDAMNLGRGRPTMTCGHCQKIGHIMNRCFFFDQKLRGVSGTRQKIVRD
nr:aminopeptidase N-like [Penaeus vannamei]